MKKKSGFTLIELLIGITVSIMIFLTASSLILLLFNTDINAKRVQAIEQAKYNIGQEISNAVRWADIVTATSNEININDGETLYKIENGKLTKNGEDITQANVVINEFSVTDYSVNDQQKSLAIDMQLSHKNFPSIKDTYRVTVSQRVKTIEGGPSGGSLDPVPVITRPVPNYPYIPINPNDGPYPER